LRQVFLCPDPLRSFSGQPSPLRCGAGRPSSSNIFRGFNRADQWFSTINIRQGLIFIISSNSSDFPQESLVSVVGFTVIGTEDLLSYLGLVRLVITTVTINVTKV
jgi:hypothetical protein